jgi:hypothetical protein
LIRWACRFTFLLLGSLPSRLKVVKQDNADAHFANLDKSELPLRHGHHEDHGNITFEGDNRVLFCEPPTAEEHDERLGLATPESSQDKAFREAGDLLETLVLWLAESATISSCGLRGFALSWMLRPRAFQERSLRQLARRLEVTPQAIAKYVAEVYGLSGGVFVSAGMLNAESRARQSKVAIAAHIRGGHRTSFGRRSKPCWRSCTGARRTSSNACLNSNPKTDPLPLLLGPALPHPARYSRSNHRQGGLPHGLGVPNRSSPTRIPFFRRFGPAQPES